MRGGLTAVQMVDRHFPDVADPFRRDLIEALRLMRARRYTYYESLGAEAP